jgi:alpha-1,2-mannosyltransferase
MMYNQTCGVLARTGLATWGIFAIVIVTLSIIAGADRSLIPLYSAASFDFWAHQVPATDYLYGYYYLPTSQILFTPFAWLGLDAGGILWRLLAFGLFGLAAWEWAKILVPNRKCDACALMLVLLIPGAAGVLRIGQFDAPMWALIFLGFAAIAHERWLSAAVMLATAFAIKPTAIVPALLAGALWPSLGLRLLPLVLIVLGMPLLFADGEFVSRLYISLFDRISGATREAGWFNSLSDLLTYVGLAVPYVAMTWVRVIAAIGTLLLGWASIRRLPHAPAVFIVFALSAIYLLLFNPRTEGIGYVALSLVTAPLAARAMLLEGRAGTAATAVLVCISVGIPGLTYDTLHALDPWFRPALAILAFVLIVAPRSLERLRWPDQQLEPVETDQQFN